MVKRMATQLVEFGKRYHAACRTLVLHLGNTWLDLGSILGNLSFKSSGLGKKKVGAETTPYCSGSCSGTTHSTEYVRGNLTS